MGVLLSGRAHALAVLAWSLVKVQYRRLFGLPTGLSLFHQNYDGDRLPAVDPAERDALPSFSRCIACGRCDLGEADRMARSAGQYPGLMTIVLASSRSMPDFDAAARAIAFVSDDVLRTKEASCPTGVPFRELARFIRAKANPAQEASPALLLPETEVARPRLGELHVADEALRPESSRSG